MDLVPVEHNPFDGTPAQPYTVPVDHDPWERAAYRMRQATQPAGGRQEGLPTRVMNNLLPVLGKEVVAPLARSMVDTVAYPGQVLKGERDYDWGGPESIGKGFDTSMMMAGAHAPFVGEGQAGIFGGGGQTQIAVLDPSKIRGKFADPAANGALPQRAIDAGHDTLTYHGTDLWEGNAIADSETYGGGPRFFSTPERQLAEKYAGKGGDVLPLALKTKDYHTIDAKAAQWDSGIEEKAIQEALKLGKPGVRIDNMIADPKGGKKTGPQTIYVSLDPSTVRRTNAAFDPAKSKLNNLLASGAAISVPTAMAWPHLQSVDHNPFAQ